MLVFRQGYAKKAITAAKIVALRCARARRSLRYVDLQSIKGAWERVAKKHGKTCKKTCGESQQSVYGSYMDRRIVKEMGHDKV